MRYLALLVFFFFPLVTKNNTNTSGVEDLYKFRPTLTNEISDSEFVQPLDSAFEKFVHDWKIVGASVAVMKEGRLLYAKGFGKPKMTTPHRLQPYHQFRLASISKLITAIGIMKLVDEGRLSLNDKVFGDNGILKDPIYKPADRRAYSITVNHLLRHLGGWSLMTMGDPMFKPTYIASQINVSSPPSFENIANYVLSFRLPYAPGTRYEYSNFGYCLLDRVIEKVTNMPYEDYIKYHILIPNDILDMRIGGNMLEEKGNNEVVHYDFTKNNFKPSMHGGNEIVPSTYGGTDIKTLAGAGGWVSSSVDLLKLVSLVDGYSDVPDILKKETILEMIRTDVPGRAPIGWRQIQNEWNWIRTGTMAGSSAIVVRQDDGITWTVLVNTSTWRSSSFNTFVKRIMSQTLSNIEEWPERDLFKLM